MIVPPPIRATPPSQKPVNPVVLMVIVLGFVLLIVFAVAASCRASAKSEADAREKELREQSAMTATSVATVPKAPVRQEPVIWYELGQWGPTVDGYTFRVKGKITNISHHTVRGLEIKLNIYNVAGDKIGVATDFLDSLDAGETWGFNAPYFSDDARSAKIVAIVATSE